MEAGLDSLETQLALVMERRTAAGGGAGSAAPLGLGSADRPDGAASPEAQLALIWERRTARKQREARERMSLRPLG